VTALTAGDLVGRQRQVYESEEDRVLVTGGPGTGKTSLALLLAAHIVTQSSNGRHVLFLTFSRSATTELLSRAPSVIQDSDLGRVEVSTFHGYSVGILEAFSRYAGGPSERPTIAVREEVQLGVAPPGSYEFDAIIPAVLDLFARAPWIEALQRSRLAAVICDEFQDTRDDQYRLLETLAKDRRLVCLADPRQMIYDGLPGAGSLPQRVDDFLATGPRVIDLGDVSHRDPTQVMPRLAAAIRAEDFDSAVVTDALRQGRLQVRTSPSAEIFDTTVDVVRQGIADGRASIGVFFATNRQVNAFADRLREEGIEHDVVGLAHASGEAELAAASLAGLATGSSSWDAVLTKLGVFLAATVRGQPPPLARQLVGGTGEIDEVLSRLLAPERARFESAASETVATFLADVRAFWPKIVRGGRRLWELGIDDLVSQTIPIHHQTVADAAQELGRIATARRSRAALDYLPGLDAPVRVMNLYQIKGRQMDLSVTVADSADRHPNPGADRARYGRLIFVAVSRAQKATMFVLARDLTGFLGPLLDVT
jgi:DNA helicase II / ATP-dependent DNA helicase PcrA